MFVDKYDEFQVLNMMLVLPSFCVTWEGVTSLLKGGDRVGPVRHVNTRGHFSPLLVLLIIVR